MNFNQVTLAGNLTRDPELRYIGTGTAVCDVGLAVNDVRGTGDKKVEEVTFVDVTIWGRQAEVISQYGKKGRCVLVSGRLKQERWEKDGQKHSKHKVVADTVRFADKLNSGTDKAEDSDVPVQSEEQVPI
jgi:single-strand DNA-binding protein